MNTIKYLSIAFIFSLVLLSCGGGGDDEPDTPTPPAPVSGKHLTQTCDMAAEASEVIITLKGLSAEIDRISGSASWLSISAQPYTGGQPEVKVSAKENQQASARQQDITFFAARDTLVLTVRQAAPESVPSTDTGKLHDTPTDQPAFSR